MMITRLDIWVLLVIGLGAFCGSLALLPFGIANFAVPFGILLGATMHLLVERLSERSARR